MHMRKKKWSRPELAASPYFVAEPAKARGHWADLFPKQQPLHLELGCGKGVSTAAMAYDNRGVNYIAMDISPDVLGVARRNLAQTYGDETPDNILLTRCDIEQICGFISQEDRIERVYINFCNPWSMRPKHHKRRLTHPRQVMQYREFLTEAGEIWFKTDDAPLFRDSLRYFEACGFDCTYCTDDLHASGFAPNYVSEHERMYTEQGLPIHFGIFRRRPGEVELDTLVWRMWSAEDFEEEVDQTVYTVKRIVEDDFGCEGLPEGEVLQVTLLLTDCEGKLRRVRMADKLAWDRDLHEGDQVCLDADGLPEKR